MPLRVRVDRGLCTGHGRCYVLAPEVFSEDERGYCVVPNPLVPDALADQARAGEDNCPESAIRVERA